MMYGFPFIRAQCGPWEEKTEMTVERVGSNLKVGVVRADGLRFLAVLEQFNGF